MPETPEIHAADAFGSAGAPDAATMIDPASVVIAVVRADTRRAEQPVVESWILVFAEKFA